VVADNLTPLQRHARRRAATAASRSSVSAPCERCAGPCRRSIADAVGSGDLRLAGDSRAASGLTRLLLALTAAPPAADGGPNGDQEAPHRPAVSPLIAGQRH
jgi:hypothetical protein